MKVFLKKNVLLIYSTSPDCLVPFGPHMEGCSTWTIVPFGKHLEGCDTWDMVPFGSHLEVLVSLGPLVCIATTMPTRRYATMVIPSFRSQPLAAHWCQYTTLTYSNR